MGINKLDKIVNRLIAISVGLLIVLLIWVAITISPPKAEAQPISPASSCLLYGKFCAPEGLCFECKVI